MERTTDILIVGAGCAGLQLMYQLVSHPNYHHESIVLVDELPWGAAEKTWCFWASPQELIYPQIVSHQWSNIEVIDSSQHSTVYCLQDFKYQQISSQDFFDFHRPLLDQFPIEFIQAKVTSISGVLVETSQGKIRANRIFSSIIPPLVGHDLHLKQHFVGWRIKTENPRFASNTMTLMDLSVPQPLDGMAFLYVLPYSATEALVEFTVFSPTVWSKREYEQHLMEISQRWGGNWKVVDQEEGCIPMYGGAFLAQSPEGIQFIGGGAGKIKPSTGYAFYRIWEHSKEMAAVYFSTSKKKNASSIRFRVYDLLLLHILQNHSSQSIPVFDALLNRVPLDRTFKFLKEQTSWWEEVLLFSKLPKKPFLRAVWERILNIIF
ncbi:MAG: lycopene cyclase family protein [Spirosomataceae bacterium]